MYQELLECEISISADPSVGRCGFVVQFFEGHCPDIECEFIQPFVKQVRVDNVSYRLSFFGPQWLDNPYEEDRQHRSIRTSGGCILMYSVTSRDSFTSIRRHHSEVIRLKEEMRKAEEKFLNAAAGDRLYYNTISYSIILVGNKIDLGDQRVVTTEEGQELARELGCEFYEVSAKMNDNVISAVHALLRTMARAGVMYTRGEWQHVWDMARVVEGDEPLFRSEVSEPLYREPALGFEPLLQSGTVTKKKRCTIL
ncbi:ras-domain-containing protein [Wilcoxina mikolae CBS 423.85]|nr:ras-domain-containing protein [Wilcoxina mikolae CBS 423.85]